MFAIDKRIKYSYFRFKTYKRCEVKNLTLFSKFGVELRFCKQNRPL